MAGENIETVKKIELLLAQSATNDKKVQQIVAVLSGYMQHEEDEILNRRSNIQIIPTNKAAIAEAPTNGGENMATTVEKAKIEYIKKRIRLRVDGRYEYRVMKNGKRTSITDKDFSTLVNIVLGKVRRQIPVPRNSLTFYDYCNNFFNTYRKMNRKPKTLVEYKNTLDNHIKKYFGKKEWNKVRAMDLQRFINQIKGDVARRKVFNFLQSVYEKAFALGDVKRNLALALELPKPKAKEKKRALLIAEQAKLLKALENCELDFKIFIYFSLVIGTRREETCNFRLKDIDENRQLLHIRGTKTENADRTIKISQAMIDMLKQCVRDRDRRYFIHDSSTYHHKLADIYKKLGFKNVDLHSLRRTCATNLYYLGIKDKQRQQILGHSSIVTTNNIYTFLENDVSAQDIRNLYGPLYFSDYE